MSIHNDPRRFSPDPEERADWERDLRFEYRREECEQKHGDAEIIIRTCEYQDDAGSCNCDGHCMYQRGKWRDTCDLWRESEDSEE